MLPTVLSITTVFTLVPIVIPLPPTIKFLVEVPEIVIGTPPAARSEFCMLVQVIPVPVFCFNCVMKKLSSVTDAGAKIALVLAGK